jgi:hypothetical protein
MNNPHAIAFPDILSALTRGTLVHIGMAQFALAVRPQPVLASHPFDVILLIQNASDQKTEISAHLHLPDQDAKRQKARFLTPNMRHVVELKPCEAGCIQIQANTLADTAPGDQYKLSVDIAVRSGDKPNRIHRLDGGASVKASTFNDDARAHALELRRLAYSAQKHPLRSTLETTFSVASAPPAPPKQLKAAWVSLWTLADADERLLVAHYSDLLSIQTFPQLKRRAIFGELKAATQARFSEAGFPLQDTESALIAKLMTLIIEYATPKENVHGYQAAGIYAIAPLLARIKQDPHTPVTLPNWFSAFLHLIARDERAASYIAKLAGRQLYYPLLRDAVTYGFALVQQTTGESLGSPVEIAENAHTLVEMLEAGRGLNFQRVYLPLIMAGVLVNDKLLMPGEQQDELVGDLVEVLTDRQDTFTPDDQDVLELTQQTIHRVTKVYGHRGE